MMSSDAPGPSLDAAERRVVDDALAWIDRPPRSREDERAVGIVARLVDIVDRLAADRNGGSGLAS
jgi:hypothetical protein